LDVYHINVPIFIFVIRIIYHVNSNISSMKYILVHVTFGVLMLTE
jgi:hypothetical protein